MWHRYSQCANIEKFMDASFELEKPKVLPKPVTGKEMTPVSCSLTPTGDILLRNDGFNAEAAYTFDMFYAHMAVTLGNMERMEVDGAVLQVRQDTSGSNSVNILLLYDKRVLLGTMASSDNAGNIFTINISTIKVPGRPPGILHEEPKEWSFEGALPNGIKVSFMPVYDIPLNYTTDAASNFGAGPRNIESPSIIVAYGKRGIVDYALAHYSNPPEPKQVNPLSNEIVADAIELVMKEVTSKIAKLKGLK